MDKLSDIFEKYELLAAQAEESFNAMQQSYGDCVKCKVQCSDCCSAVFGLFPVESAYLNYRFHELGEPARKEITSRLEEFEKSLAAMQEKIRACGDDTGKINEIMATQRIRCPMLNDQQKCAIYAHRPVTCRVYGIPTIIGGKIHACWKAGFEKGKAYPAFDLDKIYRELFQLSKDYLQKVGESDLDQAGLLVSMARAITAPRVETQQ
ncbi:YkgJ family cysteine cluster protein [Desulfotruncus alcoholivorax]|uniref:YkgJ family cysteine cluster protein n=1 Tax=Desulfotruncus alcoholivorax TaxID=265477 RepID=UPI0003F7989F|nr:YkgJ family cysteine cluster protein [Desulfotruncus alcoholivorax]